MTGDDRNQPLEAAMDYPAGHCLPELFAAQAARTPNADAISSSSGRLSYRELDEASTMLARRLRAASVGPETLVAVCLPRTPDLLVSYLAVLRAGAAYLPLDPGYPLARLTQMLRHAQPTLLVSVAEIAARLDVSDGMDFVLLDRLQEHPLALERPSAPLHADNLAHIVFTTGSTGTPKAVQLTHRAATNLLTGQRHLLGIGPGDRVLQFAPLGFDAFIWEVSMSLLTGATLVLPTEKERTTGLLDFIADAGITVMSLSPSALAELPLNSVRTDLRTVISCGETCSATLAARFTRTFRFLNAYGLVETTVCSTVGEINGSGQPPVGTPIGNVTVYVLDEQLRPAPAGGQGEIYVGGLGTARGYLNQPGHTAQRFLPDPFAAEPAGRMYRTGDRGRFDETGKLHFLGRVDHQVKVRGAQVDPIEIESSLESHPAVRRAVVLPVLGEEGPTDLRLVGYVVAEPDLPAPDHSELRAFLLARLPEYLVPATILVLDRFPLNANGKVDRAVLPSVSSARPAPAAARAGLTDLQRQLAKIWSQILGVAEVGLHDNFFDDLGGDSLRLIRLRLRIAEQLGHELDLSTLVANPTVGSLSEHLSGADNRSHVGAADRGRRRRAKPPVSRAARRRQ